MSQRPRTPKHVDISVRDRLLTLAKREGQDYNSILNLYFRERLLARLALSPHREQFVLKGGALLPCRSPSAPLRCLDHDSLLK